VKRIVSSSIILTGFAAIVSQIIFIRELLIVFYGNELSISFILASWLIGGALGSALLGRYSDRINSKISVFAACQIALSVLLPLNILLIRSVKSAIGVNPGEIIPLFPMVLSAFVILVPVCAILGFIFSLGCRLYEGQSRLGAARIGRVYVLEAIGAIIGGILVSFVLVRLLSSVQIMASLGILLAAAATALLGFSNEAKGKRPLFAAALVILLAWIAMLPLGGWRYFDSLSQAMQWKGYELVASKNSIYGNVAMVKNASQFSVFDNGLHMYTIPDRQSAEEAVHFAMLEHPDPKRVLLIGGGVSGLVEEILRHPVDSIDYVELDPLILKMAKDHLPASYYRPLTDKRVSLHFEDGRLFVKRATAGYDIIIVSLGEPYTAQLNRFYTVEFFKEAGRILRKEGVLSFGLSSSESYMSNELKEFLGSIYATLASVFPDVKAIPGETAYFLASGRKGLLTYDYRVLMRRASERGLELKYVREYYLFSRLSGRKISFTERSIMAAGGSEINRDFRPISYYYDMVFWAARFKDSLITRSLKNINARYVLAAAAIAILIIMLFGLAGRRREGSLKRSSVMAVAANGFSQMTFQVVILLAFQIIYGYIFYKVGLIITAFMAGLAIGGSYAIRALPRLKDERYSLIFVQAGLCFYSVILLPVFQILSGTSSGPAAWIGSNIIFTALPLASGLIGGFLFPLANKIFLGSRQDVGSSGGFNYGIDLLGACTGALLVGTFLVPVLGIPATCFLAAAVNAAVLITLF